MRSLLLALIALPLAAQVTITPSTPPTVNAGTTYDFDANTSVTWSMKAGSAGSIDSSTGVYTAPTSFTNKHNLHGCPALPANHVFNIKVDTLPLHPKNATWMADASVGTLDYIQSFPTNAVDATTPVEAMTFLYTPVNNGNYRIPQIPYAKVQTGYYAHPFTSSDRHILAVDLSDCSYQEMYNYYEAGESPQNCPLCTSQSGVQYDWDELTLPLGATDAAGAAISPLDLHIEEVAQALATGGEITHALHFTIQRPQGNGYHIWPATAGAYYVAGDHMALGARVRLKASFSESGYTPEALLLIRQLKDYGMILTDAGAAWQAGVEAGPWPSAMKTAFNTIAANVNATDFEIVDQSSLIVDEASGDTEVDATTVIADDGMGNTAEMRVILRGLAIGSIRPVEFIQANTAAVQLQAVATGHSNVDIDWTISPAIGSIGATTGVYTPPSSVSVPTLVTATATSNQEPTKSTDIAVWVLPTGTIRVATGHTANYTADSGSTYWGEMQYSYDGYVYGDSPSLYANVSRDVNLYKQKHLSYMDQLFELWVANGDYKVTIRQAQGQECTPNGREFHLESQGQLIYRDVDIYSLAGNVCGIDYDMEMPAVVTDGRLTFAVRHLKGEHTVIQGFVVETTAGTPEIRVYPEVQQDIPLGQTYQFNAVGWYTPSEVTWELSPNVGSIDATGLWTPPDNPVAFDTLITATATSVSDGGLSDSAQVTLLAGIPDIRLNAGSTSLTDGSGNVWAADYNYSGSSTSFGDASGTAPISGSPTELLPMYRYHRYSYGTGNFQYDFVLPNGGYDVTLHWADYRATPETYNMDVLIEGVTVEDNFSPVTAAGGTRTAYSDTYAATVADGLLTIVFDGQGGTYVGGSINGIEIVSTSLIVTPAGTIEGAATITGAVSF